jgi:hypothetical protein
MAPSLRDTTQLLGNPYDRMVMAGSWFQMFDEGKTGKGRETEDMVFGEKGGRYRFDNCWMDSTFQ